MNIKKVKGLPTEEKRLWFYLKVEKWKKMARRGNEINSVEPMLLVIERAYFLRDSFEQFKTTTDFDLRREIKINFVDEICQDAGGLIREWFSLVIEELFAPTFGLFKRAATAEVSYLFNNCSAIAHTNHLEYFYFTGQVIAKALFEQIPIKAHLSKIILKQLLNQTISVEDLKYFDEELWKSFDFLKNNTIDSDTQIGNFALSKKDPTTGNIVTIELKENGQNINIDNQNKEEYFQLYLDYSVIKASESQLKSFKSGFSSLISLNMIQGFDADELELFLCGDSKINIADWKKHTVYKGSYSEDHSVIKWFWEIVEKMNEGDKEKLLQFATGSRRVPAEGFAGLRSSNGKTSKFVIDSAPYVPLKAQYVISHTCFNTIEVPNYPDRETMESSIRQIIDCAACFQFSIE